MKHKLLWFILFLVQKTQQLHVITFCLHCTLLCEKSSVEIYLFIALLAFLVSEKCGTQNYCLCCCGLHVNSWLESKVLFLLSNFFLLKWIMKGEKTFALFLFSILCTNWWRSEGHAACLLTRGSALFFSTSLQDWHLLQCSTSMSVEWNIYHGGSIANESHTFLLE